MVAISSDPSHNPTAWIISHNLKVAANKWAPSSLRNTLYLLGNLMQHSLQQQSCPPATGNSPGKILLEKNHAFPSHCDNVSSYRILHATALYWKWNSPWTVWQLDLPCLGTDATASPLYSAYSLSCPFLSYSFPLSFLNSNFPLFKCILFILYLSPVLCSFFPCPLLKGWGDRSIVSFYGATYRMNVIKAEKLELESGSLSLQASRCSCSQLHWGPLPEWGKMTSGS